MTLHSNRPEIQGKNAVKCNVIKVPSFETYIGVGNYSRTPSYTTPITALSANDGPEHCLDRAQQVSKLGLFLVPFVTVCALSLP